jgi:sigma-B regulation protein RsbU (phosphoserine phosphatase)
MRILIVDDSKISRRTLEAVASNWGYEVLGADTGEEGWEIMQRESPRLVITDWMLPGMDGPTLCRKIRDSDARHYVYIILLTAREDKQSLVDGMGAGADDFLRKPVDFEELRARIRAGERVLNLEQTLHRQNQQLSAMGDQLRAAHAQIDRDLVLAGRMQQNLLPSRHTFINGVLFERMYCPSTHVSGDILNFFRLDERHIGFYTIDVAGHGIAAAMISFTLNRLLSPEINRGCPLKRPILAPPYYELLTPPSRVVEELNSQFQDTADNSLYFTMIYGIIDTVDRTIQLCQAGHPSPFFMPVNGSPQYVGDGGFPVALLPMAKYDSVTLSYAPGDRMFLYSDGVTECANAAGEMYGQERLKEFFSGMGDRPLFESLKQLRARIIEWNGGDSFDDDISVLAFELP